MIQEYTVVFHGQVVQGDQCKHRGLWVKPTSRLDGAGGISRNILADSKSNAYNEIHHCTRVAMGTFFLVIDTLAEGRGYPGAGGTLEVFRRWRHLEGAVGVRRPLPVWVLHFAFSHQPHTLQPNRAKYFARRRKFMPLGCILVSLNAQKRRLPASDQPSHIRTLT